MSLQSVQSLFCLTSDILPIGWQYFRTDMGLKFDAYDGGSPLIVILIIISVGIHIALPHALCTLGA